MKEKKIFYCGECPLFQYENIDGFGNCKITNNVNSCSDSCELEFLTKQLYETQQAIKGVRK